MTADRDPMLGALEGVLASRFDVTTGLEVVRRSFSPYSSSHRIEDVDIRLGDGSLLLISVKGLRRQAMLPEARRARPHLFDCPRREPSVYELVLPCAGAGPPECYGTGRAPGDIEPRWLFLERIEGAQLRHVGDFGAWMATARWIAGFHAASAFFALDGAGTLGLVSYDSGFYASWGGRAAAALRADGIPAGDVEWLRRRYRDACDILVALPTTFIHGELYPSNVVVAPDQGGRVAVLDWEMAANGPGLLDLAALTAGEWTTEQDATLVDAYLGAAAQPSRLPGGISVALGLAACRLHLALRWIGWSPKWHPPEDLQRDWYLEARRQAGELGR